MKKIRNFCIIAHIDHGKSTLADRLLEYTGAVSERDAQDQLLDNMDLEKERGITIKSHAIQMEYNYQNENYILNLIDTPGHVDFSYEVSRSIAACEGALLIVDAAQGIQAQTISNLYLALEHNLEIIPVLNKIDLPSAEPELVKDQIINLISCNKENIIPASAKTGVGISSILKEIIEKIPSPKGDPKAPLQAMIFDSIYNPFRGVEAYFKIVNGEIRKGQAVKFMATKMEYHADEIGVLKLNQYPKKTLKAGEVGYIISGIKTAKEVKVGDTITTIQNPAVQAIKGFEEVKPMVFAGIYPVDTEDFEELRSSMEKLQLNDASLTFEPESSAALGFGFRCGFLGMLHMEIIQERLEREFSLDLVTTPPNVRYKVELRSGEIFDVDTPAKMPPSGDIQTILEPHVSAEIITPKEFIGGIMTLCQNKRGIYKNTNYLTADKAQLYYDLPLGEIIFDFYDKLKSTTKGYASLDYHLNDFVIGDLKKLDILINNDPVDALSIITHSSDAYHRGVALCSKLKELIPRQMFDVPIQAALGNKVISRSTVKALKKNVTAKCYGGDITRKRKLWEKQKQGKKRMKSIGKVEIPQEALLAVLQIDSE